MTKYFGLWKVNTAIPPAEDPRVELQRNQMFHALMKQQLQSGAIKEVNTFLEGNAGYFVTGDISEEALHETLLSWAPFVTFEVHQTVPTLKTIESLIGVLRARASAPTVSA